MLDVARIPVLFSQFCEVISDEVLTRIAERQRKGLFEGKTRGALLTQDLHVGDEKSGKIIEDCLKKKLLEGLTIDATSVLETFLSSSRFEVTEEERKVLFLLLAFFTSLGLGEKKS